MGDDEGSWYTDDDPVPAVPVDPKEAKKKARAEAAAAKTAAKLKAKAAKNARAAHKQEAKGRPARVLHSAQLGDRLRHGDIEVRPFDRRMKGVLDAMVFLALGLVVLVVMGRVGLGFALDISQLTYLITFIAAILMGAGFVFNTIRWRALRGASGQKVLEKWKADLQLTIVSILALFMVVFILVIEVAALLVFIGVITPGEATFTFAEQFSLLAAIILLVQVMSFVVRENNLSSYQPHPRAVLASNILTPVAGVFMVLGLLLATGLPQSVGLLTNIAVRQGIYVVTVGVGLEFLAMRIRLRLPSVYSLFMAAVEVSRKANPEMVTELRKRAIRTYVAAIVFVTLTMAFAGAAITGNLSINNTRIAVAAGILYAGTAIIIGGLVVLRAVQRKHLNRASLDDTDDLSRLVGQKRRDPAAIARMGIYAVGGLISLILFIAAVTMFVTAEERTEMVEALDRDGELIVVEEIRSYSILDIPTTYATDVLLLSIVAIAGPYGYFFNMELKRIEAIDQKFPDFLRDLAESARAGMTLPRALVTASRGTYGALTPEIHIMAAQVEWGVEFGEALERFAQRTRTPLIDRTVALVVEAQRAGGNVVDVLTAASNDAREIKQIVAERTEQMKMYNVVVFIAFFVFIAVVLILSAQFLPAFKQAVDAATAGSGGQAQNVGGIVLAPFSVEKFNDIFFHGAIIQAIGGSLVGGVMTKGTPVGGFMSMFIMMVAAWISFRVILPVMAGG